MTKFEQVTDIMPVTPKAAKAVIEDWMEGASDGASTVPVFMHGPPGVGKSALFQQIARERQLEFLDVRLLMHEPGDFKFPLVEDRMTRRQQIRKVIKFVTPLLPKRRDFKGFIVLEEVPQAPQIMQAMAMQLVLDRRIGSYTLPPGAFVFATGNRASDRAGASKVITPLLNRFTHLEVVVSVQDWLDWAFGAGIHPWITTLIKLKPELLHQFDPMKPDRAFPTPRSWAFASAGLKNRALTESEIRKVKVAGCVGRSAALELEAVIELYEALTRRYPIERIISQPADTPVPPLHEASVAWALAGALASRASKKQKQEVHAAMQYVMRMPLELAAYGFFAVSRAGGMLAMTAPGAMEFAKKHAHILQAA